MQNPNIILILADDMGYGDMRCNNPDSKIPTPNLDQLAQQGLRFTDAHAPSSVCTPSRYSILTGRYCWRSPLKRGVLWPWDSPLIEKDRFTIGELLRGAGYSTACIGKWHLGFEWQDREGRPIQTGLAPGEFNLEHREEIGKQVDFSKPVKGGPFDRGFDYFFGHDAPNFPPYCWIENDRVLGEPSATKPPQQHCHVGPMLPGWSIEEVMPTLTQRVLRYIQESDNTPFFLHFTLTAPHTPVVPTKEFHGSSQAGDYGDFVCQVDDCVGQVVQALEIRGIADNTLLIFSSDNGPENFCYDLIPEYGHFSMGELRGIKHDTWEGGHRVPFVLRWPGIAPAGKTCDQLIMLGDLIASFADLTDQNLPPDAAEDSISVLPLFRGENPDNPPRRNMVHQTGSKGRFALREDNWVLITNGTGADTFEPDWFRKMRGYEQDNHPGQLFNLQDDPDESRNSYAEATDRVQAMQAKLDEIIHGDCPQSVQVQTGKPFSE